MRPRAHSLAARLAGAALLTAVALPGAAPSAAPSAMPGEAGEAGAPGGGVPQVLEHSVKAAFLYKFLSYVEWPAGKFADADSAVIVGVAAAPEIAEELRKAVRDRTVHGRPVEVRTVAPGESLAGVHAVFVGAAEIAHLAEFAREAREHSVLTVTDASAALAGDSVINFVPADGRVGFEVSLPAAHDSGLKLSSRMLAVARDVRRGEP